ncbi:MAG: FkbM family methyltransferase [Candidatus Lokiarchaeota archaeon]|nr:FkbM family methyltransferase [Candidatus Lokiarchaeota archaeon]
MRLITLKKEIIRDYETDGELTKFKRKMISLMAQVFWMECDIGKKFHEYMEKNRPNINELMHDFDEGSKDEFNQFFTDLEYMKNHTEFESVKYLMRNKEKILSFIDLSESLKNQYFLPVEVQGDVSVFKHKHGLKYLPLSVLNSLRGKDFLDCGGFYGDSALMFSRDYQPKSIYSFEPDPENRGVLLETIKHHDLKNVVPISLCVGEKCGKVNFYNMGPFSYVPEGEGMSVMEMTTVDEFVAERNLNVGVIKIDIEGYEMEVLEGARKTILTQKPVLLLGIYHNPREFFEAKHFVLELKPDYNFKFKILSDVRPIAEAYLIAW